MGDLARTAPAAARAPLAVGTIAVIAMALLQRIIPIVFVELGFKADWLYSPVTRGLTWLGAALIFGVAAAANVLWHRSGEQTASTRSLDGSGSAGRQARVARRDPGDPRDHAAAARHGDL